MDSLSVQSKPDQTWTPDIAFFFPWDFLEKTFQRSKILTKKKIDSFTLTRGKISDMTMESLNGMFIFCMTSIRFFYCFPILIKFVFFIEAWIEAMMFSEPTDCEMYNGTCVPHSSCHMLQFLSLRMAKIPAELDSVELYGYIAARDKLNPLLNYIVNFSRDDPIIVKQVCASIHVCNYFSEK
jgi:hypothetical protein